MKLPRVEALGRPIVRLTDAQLELIAKGQRLDCRMRNLGIFTTYTARSMDPPPEPGDSWVECDPVTQEAWRYVQLSTAMGQRLRDCWPVVVERA